MDYNQVASFILTEANHDQLVCLVDAIKMRRTQLARRNVFTLRPGDTVSFIARGRNVNGTVIKVMQKNVQVKEGSTTWRVPAQMLSKSTITG